MLSDFFVTTASGDPDPGAVYFARGDDRLGSAGRDKLSAIATRYADQQLNVVGTASDDEEYADSTARRQLIHRRVENVVAGLRAEGWRGQAALREKPRNTASSVDPRPLRRVTVTVHLNQPATAGTLTTEPASGSALDTARTLAHAYAVTAIKALDESHCEYARVSALARRLFGTGVDLPQLTGRLFRLASHLDRLRDRPGEQPHEKLRDRLDEQPHRRQPGPDGGTLCFRPGPATVGQPEQERIFAFIHSSAHTALCAQDLAYARHRRFWVLDHESAMCNADTYALFVLQAAVDGYQPPELPPADDVGRLHPLQARIAAQAVADAEWYLERAADDVHRIYRDVWNALLDGGDWRGRYAGSLAVIREIFPAEFAPRLSRPDDIVLTGIYRRLRRIGTALDRSLRFEVREGVAAIRHGALCLPSSFFGAARGRTDVRRVAAVLLAFATDEPTVPPAQRERYAALVTELAESEHCR